MKCPATRRTDDACAIANTDGDKDGNEAEFVVDPPWDAPDKNGGNLDEAQFIEGAVNLTDLGLSGCFPVFMANSRSSQIPGSTLHDFARSPFEQCGAGIPTTPSCDEHRPRSEHHRHRDGDGLGANPPAPTGNVTFVVCGPTSA